jgi:hypothetical protein
MKHELVVQVQVNQCKASLTLQTVNMNDLSINETKTMPNILIQDENNDITQFIQDKNVKIHHEGRNAENAKMLFHNSIV